MVTSNVRDLDGTFDEAYADLRESNDEAYVTYTVARQADRIVIQRTVTKVAARARDRILLWQSDEIVLHRGEVGALIHDLVCETVS